MNLFLNIASVLKHKKTGVLLLNKGRETMELSYYQLQKKGSSVDICFSQQNINSVESIDPVAEKVPNILCIQGIGLVQRVVDKNCDDINQSIPNINQEEYLVLSGGSPGNKKLIALYRKEQLNDILSDPGLTRIPVTGISLGFDGVQEFLQLFENQNMEFIAGLNSLLIENGEIKNISKCISTGTNTYAFADKQRNANEILALCTGLQYFIKPTSESFKIQWIKEQTSEFTARKVSEYILRFVGAGLLVLLLINFLLFDSYNKQLNQLSIEAQEIVELQTEIKELRDDLTLKKQFVSEDNVPGNYSFAFYADHLASYVEDGVRFIELSICPVRGKIKDDKVIEFTGNTLVVKGTSPNSAVFSKFTGKINEANWVKTVEKQVYSYNNENMHAEFELEIILNDAIK